MRTLIVFFLFCPFYSLAQDTSGSTEQAVFNLEALKNYDGAMIREIRIHGLRWTREQAVRWLLSQHENDVFHAQVWVKGLHKLYNSTVLYNIRTDIHRVDERIDIDLSISDRWTFLPFGTTQSGGGSYNIGGGVADVNAFGSFAQLSAGYSMFDNVASYDLNYYQEFIRDTEFMGGLDVSSTGTPVDLQRNDGTSLGSFTWQRQQEQILIGHRFEPEIRFLTYLETFQDKLLVNDQAPDVSVDPNPQFRVRPTIVFGRSNWTNFLEHGHEFTLAPTTANPFQNDRTYSTLVVTYKRVYIDNNTNSALFLNVGAMSHTQIPYLFHLGGYDTVRGFSTNRAVGRYYINNSLEYRPYLFRVSLPLVDEMIVQGCLFQDLGLMWNSANLSESRRVNSNIFLLSHGLGTRLNFMRFAGAIIRLDLAHATIPNEGWGLSAGVGQFF